MEIISALTTAAVATAVAAIFAGLMRPLMLDQKIKRQKRREKLKDQIKKKIGSDIELDANEIADIGRGYGLSSGSATEALYELYSEAEDSETHATYKQLLTDINRTEPFESLPAETRPSLARISEICEASTLGSDKELLHPITKVLDEYQEMKRDHAAMKKQNRVSYMVALVSFFVGLVGLILAFTGPSKDFIQTEINKSTENIQLEIRNAQQGAPADR